MININRVKDEFMRQAGIDSPSFKEGNISAYLNKRFSDLGAQVEFDNAGPKVGSEVGNMIIRYPGKISGEPLLLCVHMDTVSPAIGVEPQLVDGLFTSAGDTVLGGDDKSGIVEILEALEVIKEQQIDHVDLEIVITICEEEGLLGAKELDFSQFKSRQGIAIDTTGVDIVIDRAPAANRFTIDIHGLEAHAGINPDQGISAIEIAARAISAMPLGRIDEETTSNIGTIHGGHATNIVANRLSLRGEVRSHNRDKLSSYTQQIINAVEKEVEAASISLNGEIKKASMSLDLHEDFPPMRVSESAEVLKTVIAAGEALGRPQQVCAAGGGSDANIFNENGIAMVIMASGMDKVHTINEQIKLDDMVKASELLVEVIRRYRAA